MKITKLNPLMKKRAEQMIHDMRGVGSVEVREEIACELARQGYVKTSSSREMNDKKELHLRIQRTDNLNTVVYDDTIGPGNGRHYYEVERDGKTLAEIQFQNSARNEEVSIAGVLETDLLEIVRHRLQCFQQGEYATRENACALTHIEEALMWLNKRVADRKERGVLGTMNK